MDDPLQRVRGSKGKESLPKQEEVKLPEAEKKADRVSKQILNKTPESSFTGFFKKGTKGPKGKSFFFRTSQEGFELSEIQSITHRSNLNEQYKEGLKQEIFGDGTFHKEVFAQAFQSQGVNGKEAVIQEYKWQVLLGKAKEEDQEKLQEAFSKSTIFKKDSVQSFRKERQEFFKQFAFEKFQEQTQDREVKELLKKAPEVDVSRQDSFQDIEKKVFAAGFKEIKETLQNKIKALNSQIKEVEFKIKRQERQRKPKKAVLDEIQNLKTKFEKEKEKLNSKLQKIEEEESVFSKEDSGTSLSTESEPELKTGATDSEKEVTTDSELEIKKEEVLPHHEIEEIFKLLAGKDFQVQKKGEGGEIKSSSFQKTIEMTEEMTKTFGKVLDELMDDAQITGKETIKEKILSMMKGKTIVFKRDETISYQVDQDEKSDFINHMKGFSISFEGEKESVIELGGMKIYNERSQYHGKASLVFKINLKKAVPNIAARTVIKGVLGKKMKIDQGGMMSIPLRKEVGAMKKFLQELPKRIPNA